MRVTADAFVALLRAVFGRQDLVERTLSVEEDPEGGSLVLRLTWLKAAAGERPLAPERLPPWRA